MFGEYKIIVYAVIGLMLFGIGSTAVLSYNHFVSKAAKQEEQIKLRDSVINDQQAIVSEQKRQADTAKQYQQESDSRRIQSEDRLKKILTMESKRDEKDNITPDDPILGSLNGMYPNNKAGEDKTNTTTRTTVPKKHIPTGDLAGRKDILPQ